MTETRSSRTLRAVLAALTSPSFLYTGLDSDGAPAPYTVASRLAMALWDSLPDDERLGFLGGYVNKFVGNEEFGATASNQRT